MRKTTIITIVFLLLTPVIAYAHITGAFKDFLVGIKDENATQKLEEELAVTKEEIARLAPQVEQLGAEYTEKQEEQMPKLRFYQSIGLDVYMNFILESEDMVDVLANQRLIEMKLEEDINALNRLYLEYMQVKVVKDSMLGHQHVLEIIESNLASRQQFLDKFGHLSEEQMEQAAEDKWATEAAVLDEVLVQDYDIIKRRIHQVTTQKTAQSPFRLEDQLLNEYTYLQYYIQSDHVYAHYVKNEVDIILIGVVSRDDPQTASLKFEAGFMNGIRIADSFMNQLFGFEIDYSKLNSKSKDFYVEQTNGAIVLIPYEQSKE